MTLEQAMTALDHLLRLRDEIEAKEFIRKDDALQHLEWAISHLAEHIWQKAMHLED